MTDRVESVAEATQSAGSVLSWFAEHADSANVTLLIASLALLASIWTAVITRRSARATQAQADAAWHQAMEATSALAQARSTAEAAALETARSRIYAVSPKPIIAIESIPWPPLIDTSLDRDALRVREDDQSDIDAGVLDFWNYRFSDLSFLIKGSLYNGGSEPFRFAADGPELLSGKTPFSDDVIEPPLRIHPRLPLYVLQPGQTAAFQFIAQHTLDDWIDLAERVEGLRYPNAQLICLPGSSDDTLTIAKIELTGQPVELIEDENGDSRIIRLRQKHSAQMDVTVEYIRRYPRSFEEIHAILAGDFWKLNHALMRQGDDRRRSNL